MTLQSVSFDRHAAPKPRLTKPYAPGKRDKRFWTEEEREIVRRYYPAGGTAACLAHLPPHRTPTGVYSTAQKLGLRSEKTVDVRGQHQTSPELDDRIREEWLKLDGKKRGAVNDLADRLGVPRWWLSNRARKLQLTMPHRKEPPWTAAENELMKSVPLHDPDRCAEVFRDHGFNRTPTAIVVRAKRLDLSRRAARPTLSATRCAKILGIDSKWVTAWILSGDLVAVKRDDNRLPQQGGSAWDVTRADLRSFIVERLEHIDFRKVDKFALVDVLTSPLSDNPTS